MGRAIDLQVGTMSMSAGELKTFSWQHFMFSSYWFTTCPSLSNDVVLIDLMSYFFVVVVVI
jgi:hypothetical protein